VLRDAFVMDIVRKNLVSQNLNAGQMFSKSGAAFSLVSKQSSAFVSALPVSGYDFYFYAVEKDGVEYFRNPYFDTRTGDFHNFVLQTSVSGKDSEIVQVAYTACMIANCENAEQIRAISSDFVTDVITL
jgi:hypothetical protein